MGLFAKFKEAWLKPMSFDSLNEGFYDDLEEALILADVGMDTAVDAVAQLKKRAYAKLLTHEEDVKNALRDILAEKLSVGDPALDLSTRPSVALIIGVNGVGKTTLSRCLCGLLRENGVEMISADLLAPGALDSLPDAENVIYMAGKKFGTDGNEYATWAMNTWLPSRVAERYQNSRIVVFSSGNLYPKVGVHSGGATEETRTEPVGEYCMSCQGRERMFEYAAKTYGTRVAVYRLNYAVDLRYGVLYDMAHNILEGKPISITTPSFNCIWQGDANEAALRLLGHASAEVFTLNVTGPETAGVQETAKKLGALLGREPIFTGEASDTAYLNNAGKMFRLFGYPTVPLETLIEWQAQWILDGGRALGKPTHFEERKGSY